MTDSHKHTAAGTAKPGSDEPQAEPAVNSFLGALLLVNAMLQIMRSFVDGMLVEGAAALVFIVLCFVAAGQGGRRSFAVLILVAAVLGAAGLFLDDPADVARQALSQGGFLSAYVSVIALLQAPARRSRAVSDLGAFVTLRPPRSRYLWLAIAGQILGALLLFAMIALLAPLVREGVRRSQSDPLRAKIRLERQALALFRSFSWMLLWAPTTAAMAIMHRAFPDLDDVRMLVTGLAVSVLVSLIGWLDDSVLFRRILQQNPEFAMQVPEAPPREPFPMRAALRFGLVVGLLWFGTFGIRAATGAILTIGLMIACLTVVFVWLVVQDRLSSVPRQGLTGRLATTLFSEFSGAVSQVFVLGMVGVLGTLLSAALSGPLAEHVAVLTDVGPMVFLLGLVAVISSVTLIAISPMAIIIVVASTLASFPVLPVGHTEIALTMLIAWAWASTASPNSFVGFLVAQYFGTDRLDLWRGNIRFSLVGGAIMLGFLVYLTTW